MKRTLIVIGFTMILAAALLAACQTPAPSVVSANTEPQSPTSAPAATEAAATALPAAPATTATEAAAAGPAVPVSDEIMPLEQCTTCHKHSGSQHQVFYNSLYQDGVINVGDLNYAFTAPATHTVTFTLTKDGQPFNASSMDALAIFYTPYADGKFQFENGLPRLNLKGKITCDAGKCTSVLTSEEEVYKTNFRTGNGIIVLYGSDEVMGTLPARISMPRYVAADVLTIGTVDYVSAANAEGCTNCHTDPFLKHGNILAQVNGDPKTDFITCKACHVDNGEGGHLLWQALVDDPKVAVELNAGAEPSAEVQEKYAYQTTLMNDTHMSHAMEFPYPQSMANCSTCHEGKLDQVLSDENFNITTCKSCHPMDGAVEKKGEEVLYDTTTHALKTIIPEGIHGKMDWATTDCASCHSDGGAAKPFSQIHTGYNQTIYATPELKYADAIKVSIDEAAFADGKLNVKFSAAMEPAIEGLSVTEIEPTVIVNLYGWDTKDFIVSGHDRPFDDNGDGVVDNKDQRAMEFKAGSENPRGVTNLAADGKWDVTVDLTPWADKIADGSVIRVEIGVMPKLALDEMPVAIDGVTRTFSLKANAFDDKFYKPVADASRCETCHGALAVDFHSPEYGGSLTLCRMCHVTKSGGSHLEMQSRSLDSYVHAIHAGQYFDTDEVDFSNPFEKLEYEHHVEFPFPRHGTNCESCHLPGTYELGDPALHLPSLLSASNENETWNRELVPQPAMVVGQGVRVCGSCHKTAAINEDSNIKLELFNEHVLQNGYMIDAGEKPADTLAAVIARFVELFK